MQGEARQRSKGKNVPGRVKAVVKVCYSRGKRSGVKT